MRPKTSGRVGITIRLKTEDYFFWKGTNRCPRLMSVTYLWYCKEFLNKHGENNEEIAFSR